MFLAGSIDCVDGPLAGAGGAEAGAIVIAGEVDQPSVVTAFVATTSLELRVTHPDSVPQCSRPRRPRRDGVGVPPAAARRAYSLRFAASSNNCNAVRASRNACA